MVDIEKEFHVEGLSELAKRIADDLAEAGGEDLARRYLRQFVAEREAMIAAGKESLTEAELASA
jgi:hypothetical protein